MKASQRNMVPIIGEVIPSRWAFEALVVEQFSSNAYQAKYFIVEREKFLAQYYGDIHAPEIRSAIYRYNQDTNDNEKIFIENELKILGKIARIEPYQSGDSYLDYIDKATDKLKERAHNYTAYLDQLHKEDIRNYGSDYINDLKKRNHNKAIEDMVTGIGSSRFYKKSQNRLYPKIGQVYIKPDNKAGRAHFYSYEKNIGGYTFFYLCI